VQKVVVDKRMSKHLTKSGKFIIIYLNLFFLLIYIYNINIVTSGSKYLLSWKPEKRPPKILKVKAIKNKAIKNASGTPSGTPSVSGDANTINGNSLIENEGNLESINEVVDEGVNVQVTQQLLDMNDFVPDPKDAIHSLEETDTDSAPIRTPKPKPPDEINI
jgi:hypothetical protein